MLIKCPKCKAEYKIEDDKVPEGGLKMHCHACGEVFRAYREDLKEEKKPEDDSVDLSKMFERVSKATNNLFSDAGNTGVPTKVRVIHSTSYKNTISGNSSPAVGVLLFMRSKQRAAKLSMGWLLFKR